MSSTEPHRGAVFAHHDPDGEVAPHVRRVIRALKNAVGRVIVVSTAPLTADSQRWLRDHAELVMRPNRGHDFASYRVGVEQLGVGSDEIMLVNDSAVYLQIELDRLMCGLSTRGADFWGITPGFEYSRHVQSYFLAFGRDVVGSPAWRAFWLQVDDSSSRQDVILRYEVGLSRRLIEEGFVMDTWFRPSAAQRVRGAARAHSGDLKAALEERNPRRIAGWFRRLHDRARHPEWNVAIALADAALRKQGRLPAVKISTLRDDPYRLGASSLLSLLERRYPVDFAGVRDYLERTDRAYGDRWSSTLSARPPLFRYRRR